MPIYARRRRDPRFAEAVQAALLDTAIRSLTPDGTPIAPDPEAIAGLPPPLARMTPDQALHRLALHPEGGGAGRVEAGA
ncbi:MAG: hypothetical protein B7Y45_14310 [Sphingomonas sp. 28-66-16]|nr:MAG: hypothetical protein B7Y45_14310 [Sphingomonas sp. 28-66-16]